MKLKLKLKSTSSVLFKIHVLSDRLSKVLQFPSHFSKLTINGW